MRVPCCMLICCNWYIGNAEGPSLLRDPAAHGAPWREGGQGGSPRRMALPRQVPRPGKRGKGLIRWGTHRVLFCISQHAYCYPGTIVGLLCWKKLVPTPGVVWPDYQLQNATLGVREPGRHCHLLQTLRLSLLKRALTERPLSFPVVVVALHGDDHVYGVVAVGFIRCPASLAYQPRVNRVNCLPTRMSPCCAPVLHR